MTIINTVAYDIYPLHNRFMVEEFLNGEYDSFRRALTADMNYFIGGNFHADKQHEATYLLTQNVGNTWTLTTSYNGKQIREESLSENKVRHLFEILPAEFRIRTLGEDVETNYEYRLANK